MSILVTGATGTVGRHVVTELLRRGLPVRALTRDPSRAALPAGVEVVAGDLAVPDSLTAAFDGATAAHLINFAGDGYAPLEDGQAIADLAVKSGVRRVTLLGGRAEGELEQALAAADLEWTILTPVEFMANTLQWWAPSVRAEDVVREPFGSRTSSLVHEADIGAVAAAVLADGGYAGESLVITGPERITTTEKVRILGDALGREIRYVELTEDEARAKWAADGLPAPLIDFLIDTLGNPPEVGRTVRGTVERVTGRPARPFAQWARENAEAFRP
ncbi:NmrA family NAD(P)-binding protein [Actinomadura violacea]|uniref:NmrA family NAD(P)-binding protein n=1 Tax=Actinomadura violacea TaxID=2819934 RepID=A0ABS3RVG2_9ACTN|nr:NmrA family NAD(P)-binding protein [Actinomadura violacea]MBO2460754.1 NmrA family NAD(P)-binding protein [Actinomadura violacea]